MTISFVRCQTDHLPLLQQWQGQDTNNEFFKIDSFIKHWHWLVPCSEDTIYRFVYMIQHGDEIVGLIDVERKATYALLNVYIEPSKRGQGLGRQVGQQLPAFFASIDFSYPLKARVHQDNQASQKLIDGQGEAAGDEQWVVYSLGQSGH